MPILATHFPSYRGVNLPEIPLKGLRSQLWRGRTYTGLCCLLELAEILPQMDLGV